MFYCNMFQGRKKIKCCIVLKVILKACIWRIFYKYQEYSHLILFNYLYQNITCHSGWIPFKKENNANDEVTFSGREFNVHSVKMPCNGGWFKLYYNTGHFEIFAKNRGITWYNQTHFKAE